MKLDVPFYTQGHNECGPTSLQMAFEFLGSHVEKEDIKKSVMSNKSGMTWTIGLVKAAAEYGLGVEFYSTCIGHNPDNYSLEYYREHGDAQEQAAAAKDEMYRFAREHGAIMEEKSLPLDEILAKVTADCIPVVLLDWNRIDCKEGYKGHFLPIVGFTREYVYVHQPGPRGARPYQRISKRKFDEARKAKGTDEDTIFIHRRGK